MPEKPQKPRSPAVDNLKRIMTEYFAGSHQGAAEGKFVVWCAIMVPLELFHGFDIVVAVPENHAAMCAAKGVGDTQAQHAEARGYSMDLCSYARIDLGTLFAGGQGSPSMGLPRPDLLISDNNNCSLLVKWFEAVARELGVEHFVLDVPFCYEAQQESDRRYIRGQFEDLIALISARTGQGFDPLGVEEALAHSVQSFGQWQRLLSFGAHRPAGITAFDTFVHMGPFLTPFRGTPTIVEHFKMLADEIEANMQQGIFPVPEEKFRLLWDNIAPWHQLRNMSRRLAQLSANLVMATYTACIGTIEGGRPVPPLAGDPLDWLARIQNFSVCPYGMKLRQEAMERLIRTCDIDGVVFASNRSCKVYSVMQLDLQRRIQESTGVQTVMVDLDHADPRKYDEEKTFVQLEALLESIEKKRSPRGP